MGLGLTWARLVLRLRRDDAEVDGLNLEGEEDGGSAAAAESSKLSTTSSPGAEGDLRLIKVAPGQVLPEHGHGGSELTLILKGSYSDEFGTYTEGDLSDLGDDVEHRPISDPTEGCICLIASERKARFKDVVSRIVQPLTGL